MLALGHWGSWRTQKQIRYLLHVDLQERYCDSELRLVRILLYVVEYVANTPWYYAAFIVQITTFIAVEVVQRGSASKYRMSLPTSSLSVGHYHAIETI